MGKLGKDIALLNRNNKRKVSNAKKQDINPKRRKRKKDIEKLNKNVLHASKDSLIRIYRNGAKGKEVRKGKLQPSKFYKARVQGEVAKFLNQEEASEKSEDVLEPSPNTVRVDCVKKDKLFENVISSDEDIQCRKSISNRHLTNSRKFTWSAMFRYEEFCSMICSENFDEHDTIVLSDMPDPIIEVKENLKRIHTNAMRQHFSRPNVKITDYMDNDINKDNSSKSPIVENDIKDVTNNKQSGSYLSSNNSESLTADAVEDSYLENSSKCCREIDDNKFKSDNNVLFSIPKKSSKSKIITKKINPNNDPSNFELPLELFDRPVSTITSSTDDENKNDNNCERCLKRDTRSGILEDKVLIKDNRKYVSHKFKKNQIDIKKDDKIENNDVTLINERSFKFQLSQDDHHRCMNTQKFIEDFVKDRKKKHKIRETFNDINVDDNNDNDDNDNDDDDDELCKNLNARAMAWKSMKNFKHVPTILRRSICDPTNINNLNYIINKNKRDGVKYFQESSNKSVDFNFNISPSVSVNDDDNSIIKMQCLKRNDKYYKNKHRTIPLNEQSSTIHRTIDFCIPVEMNGQKKNPKSNLNKETMQSNKESMQLRRSQKSITFAKGVLFNSDPSMKSNYSINPDQTEPITNVRQTKDKLYPKHCQILRQEISRNDNQPFLLRSTKSDLIYRPEVTFINPSDCDTYMTTTTSKNNQNSNDNKQVCYQIINQSINKSSNEQKFSNQGLVSNKSNNLTTYGQTLPQSMIQQQQSVVPVTSQNIQFMFQDNDPHVYAFSELQNLQLLTLNDKQNVYVNGLNSLHEQKRSNECVMVQNVDQPTKYLAIEKDLNAQRIPIYFHNNNQQTIGQEYVPCKMITALEKQNNDKIYFRDDNSKVILLQGRNHLNDKNRQYVE